MKNNYYYTFLVLLLTLIVVFGESGYARTALSNELNTTMSTFDEMIRSTKTSTNIASQLVTNTNDAGPGSLRQAIIDAAANDTITFDPTIDGDTIKLTSGEIVLNKNLTIVGNGFHNTIISADSNSRVFNIQNQSLKLTKLTLLNGRVPTTGGGLNVVAGGLIYADKSNLIIHECRFLVSRASIGGAIFFKGNQPSSGQTLNDITLDSIYIISSIFQGNSTWNGSTGGAVETRYAKVRVENSLFSGNVAQANGGGLYIFTSQTEVINTTVSGNYAGSFGGGIQAYVPFSGNIGETFTMTNSVVSGNIGSFNHNMGQCNPCVINYSLNGDHTPTTGTGNITHTTDPLFVAPQVATSTPTVAGNYSLQENSALVDAGDNSATDLLLDVVENPRNADGDLDGLDDIDIGSYEIKMPCVNPLLVTNTDNDGCGSLRHAVESAQSGDTVRFDPLLDGDTIMLLTQIVIDTHIVILGNGKFNTLVDGMANSRIFEVMDGDSATCSGMTLQNGYADSGGAILNGGHLQLEQCYLVWNRALTDGGAILNNNNLTISRSCFAANSASHSDGGAIYNNDSLSIVNSLLSGNNTDDDGGALFNNTAAYVSLLNTTFSGNYSYYGGAIYNWDGTLFAQNCLFAENDDDCTGAQIYNRSGGTIIDGGSNLISDTTGVENDFPTSTLKGSGNNLIDPKFVQSITASSPQVGGDFQLQLASPARDAGDTTGIASQVMPLDLEGNDRIRDLNIDIGPYEIQREICIGSNSIVYVSSTGTASNTGADWANATSLQNAIIISNCPMVSEIWVAAGTYKPGTNREDAFATTGHVKIYGGFTGTETLLSERDWHANATILSGDIGTPLDSSDNSYTVVRLDGDSIYLDGFIIEEGNADASSGLIERFGAGIYMSGSSGDSNQVSNCIIRNNYGVSGVGLANFSGGLITLTNTLFHHNVATASGGAIGAEGGNTHLINCTVTENHALTGGALQSFNGNFSAVNTIFVNNTPTTFNKPGGSGTIEYSYTLFDDNYPTTPNTTNNGHSLDNTDPLFSDTTNNNYRLQPGSPAIDAGLDSLNMTMKDLAAIDRKLDGLDNDTTTIDIGAYEFFNPCSSVDSIIYVNAAATGSGDGASWTNAFTDLESALALQGCSNEIRVASGIYKPSASRNCTSGCTTNREFYFLIDKDIVFKGSYVPDTDNDPTNDVQDYASPSILDGNIGGEGSDTDNIVHILITIDLTDAALIDGFYIQNGNADDELFSSPARTNLEVNGHNILVTTGAGMYNINSAATISKLIVQDNYAFGGAGGIYNDNSPIKMSNSIVASNTGDFVGGGIYNNFNSDAKFTNVLIYDNYGKFGGGGVLNSNGSNINLINTSVVGNSALFNGGGMQNYHGTDNIPSTVEIYNSVFYNNNAIIVGGNDIHINDAVSIIQAISSNNFSEDFSHSSFTDLSTDPFVNSNISIGIDNLWNTSDDGLMPIPGGVLIDAGDSSKTDVTTDINENMRLIDGNGDGSFLIDVGAYEFDCENAIRDTMVVLDVCNSFDAPSGGKIWTSSGLYKDTIPSSFGCDSIITFDLKVHRDTIVNLAVFSISSYTSPSGNYVWNTSGVYVDQLTSFYGCDSTLIIDLTIAYPLTVYSIKGPQAVCENDTATYYLDRPVLNATDQIWQSDPQGTDFGNDYFIDFDSYVGNTSVELFIKTNQNIYFGIEKDVVVLDVAQCTQYRCQDNVHVSAAEMQNMLVPSHVKANQLITSDGKVKNNEIYSFNSGNEVELQPGFEVELGGELEVKLEGCN